MYYAIHNFGEIKIKEIDGDLENEFNTFNEMKLIKTRINGEVKVYILLFAEITDSKSLIMAHGGRYLKDKLVISDYVDDREYSLTGELYNMNTEGEKGIIDIKVDKCKFVEFPMIDELLKVNFKEFTEFITCLEVIKNNNGDYIELTNRK